MFDANANGVCKRDDSLIRSQEKVKDVSHEVSCNQFVISKSLKKDSVPNPNTMHNLDTIKVLSSSEKEKEVIFDEVVREISYKQKEYGHSHRLFTNIVSDDNCSLNENKENNGIKEKDDSIDIGPETGTSLSNYLKLDDGVITEKDDLSFSLSQNISLEKECDLPFDLHDRNRLDLTVNNSNCSNELHLFNSDTIIDLLDEIIEMVSKECDPIKCDVCQERFNSDSQFLLHVKIHPKPFKCKVCNKFFASTSHLKRHANSHSGVRPYKCEVCGKDFTQSSNLVRHSKTHKEKTYKWTICHKLFKTICYSQVHTRSATGEKSYKCKACNKDFPHSVRLIRHTKVHTLKTPLIFDQKPNWRKNRNECFLNNDQNMVVDKWKESSDKVILNSNDQNFNPNLSKKDGYEKPSCSVMNNTE